MLFKRCLNASIWLSVGGKIIPILNHCSAVSLPFCKVTFFKFPFENSAKTVALAE